MKKIFAVSLIMLFLCSCGFPKTDIEPVLENISFVAEVSYYNENYTFSGEADADGGILLEVVSPDEISGMQLIHKGDKVSISYKGLTYVANDKLPLAHTTEILYGVLSDLKTDNLGALKNGGNLSAEGKIGSREYIADFSPSGILLKLKVPSLAFEAVFSDVKLLKTE